MTTTTASTLPTTTVRAEQPARRLRLVLAANAATSALAGVAALVGASAWADTLGIDSTGIIRLVGAGLVLFAVDVALAARSTHGLCRNALVISMLDLAWVLATAIVLATGDLTTTGTVVALVMGVGVLDFALLQLWLRRRLGA